MVDVKVNIFDVIGSHDNDGKNKFCDYSFWVNATGSSYSPSFAYAAHDEINPNLLLHANDCIH